MKKHSSVLIFGIGQFVDWLLSVLLIICYPIIFLFTWTGLIWPSIADLGHSGILFHPIKKCFVQVKDGKHYVMDIPEEVFAIVASSFMLGILIALAGSLIYSFVLPHWIWVLSGLTIVAIIGLLSKCWLEFHKEVTGYYDDDDDDFPSRGCCGGSCHCHSDCQCEEKKEN